MIIDKNKKDKDIFFFDNKYRVVADHYIKHNKITICSICKKGDILFKKSQRVTELIKINKNLTNNKERHDQIIKETIKLSREAEILVKEAYVILKNKNKNKNQNFKF